MSYPLTFHPVFMQRLWGGTRIQEVFGKTLPAGELIGESWEITDRPEAVSVIANGPWAGRDLRWLMQEHRDALLGPVPPCDDRFPLLIKILDARQDLSVQVHPPARIAASLKGEPKTEMWYVVNSDPEARLYAGLKSGIDRRSFETHLSQGTVAECLHTLEAHAGDALFLPSGRVHAIGKGYLLFEVQQNSDTTYRVFDWNRVDTNGQPRQLHVEASLASIDFEDHEPHLITSRYSRSPTYKIRYLVHDPLFNVDACRVKRGLRFHLRSEGPQILGLIKGRLEIAGGGQTVLLQPGQFVLLPADLERATLEAQTQVEFLHILPGHPAPMQGATHP